MSKLTDRAKWLCLIALALIIGGGVGVYCGAPRSVPAAGNPSPPAPGCVPQWLCPYPGNGGSGAAGAGGVGAAGGAGRAGVGGVATAGRGGIGGRGGSGGVGVVAAAGRGGSGGRAGGGGGITGGVTVKTPLKLDKTRVSSGQVLSGTVTYGNTSSAPITLLELAIAARPPGGSHSGGPYEDLLPYMTDVTIPANGSVTVNASRIFRDDDPLGRWESYSSYRDESGWHDSSPSVYFDVVAASTGGSGGRGGTGGRGGSGGIATGGSGAIGGGGSGGSVGPLPNGMTVGTQEWFIAGWAGTTIYKSNVNWATAYSSGADIWNPQFISDLQGFTVFRHMDTNAVNWSKISSWNQRKLPTDPGNAEIYIDGSSPPSTTGMAVEWQIDLCNRANIDCWFTHPYLADDNYIRQEATLIKSKLKSNLRVYIELSNEVWNGSFSAFDQAIEAGQAGGLPGANEWYQGIAHEMYRALQIYQIYQDVFGAGAMGDRVIRVFSESGNLDLTTEALANVYKTAKWNPSNQKIDMMALAPYIGNGVNGASENLTRWKSEVDQKVNGEPIAVAVTQNKNYGIPRLGCYEAGMHHLQNADVWAANPQAYDAYIYMLERFATKMNAPCSLYTLHGTWEPGGAWGLFNNVGQSLAAAPKARGTKDWINGARTPTGVQFSGVPFIVAVLVLLLLGYILRNHVFTQQHYETGKPQWFFRLGYKTLALQPILAGLIIGLFWLYPEPWMTLLIEGLVYFALAGAVSVWLYDLIKGLFSKKLPGDSGPSE